MLMGLFAAFPAAAETEVCAQRLHNDGHEGSAFLHFAPDETCFTDREARLTGYAVLIQNQSRKRCTAMLGGGVFTSRDEWVWDEPREYQFRAFETKEIVFDYSRTEPDIAVGDIRLLYSAKGIRDACDGALSVRYSSEDPLPNPGTYYNVAQADAWFRIMAESGAVRPVPQEPVPARPSGPDTFIRLPSLGVQRVAAGVALEAYTAVRHSRGPMPMDARMEGAYELQRWADDADEWHQLRSSDPIDATRHFLSCGDGVPDCYGIAVAIGHGLPDGFYRVRAHHRMDGTDWGAWSEWRVFTVDHAAPRRVYASAQQVILSLLLHGMIGLSSLPMTIAESLLLFE